MNSFISAVSVSEYSSDSLTSAIRSEYPVRRSQLIERMDERNIDLLVISSAANRFYLCGSAAASSGGSVLALLLTRDGKGRWVGRRTEMSRVNAMVEASGWSEIVRYVDDGESSYDALGEMISALTSRGQKIGMELSSLSLSPQGVDHLRSVLTDRTFVDSTGAVEESRAIKSEAEIELLRRAGCITAGAVESAFDSFALPMTDSDLAASVQSSLLTLGSGPLPKEPYVVSGVRSALAHSTYANLTLLEGELVNVETGGVYEGYCAPVFRTGVIGAGSKEMYALHEASRLGLEAGLSRIEPGMTSAECDNVVRSSIRESGFDEYFPVRAAYGIGVGLYPSWSEDHVIRFAPGDQRQIVPSMTFHLTPALYHPGYGCVCCSMSVVVTENGLQPLVPIRHDMFEM